MAANSNCKDSLELLIKLGAVVSDAVRCDVLGVMCSVCAMCEWCCAVCVRCVSDAVKRVCDV